MPFLPLFINISYVIPLGILNVYLVSGQSRCFLLHIHKIPFVFQAEVEELLVPHFYQRRLAPGFYQLLDKFPVLFPEFFGDANS